MKYCQGQTPRLLECVQRYHFSLRPYESEGYLDARFLKNWRSLARELRMRVGVKQLTVEIENETTVFVENTNESLLFKIEMRVRV